ncbi:DUF4148 domain-containing protein [Burkholderia cepacia]|uniref:DUF4148 domain-containing protein n=1 Tax=Burkholderia cepacia TaxID=292 RepID=A0AAX2RW74_BURCE|nr:DUF4148 domain-containing protein [Burkholderia cepacia]MCA7899756.1 DUF4148 domain-containing protein [Burkholderia cepacia]TES78292.1 DUF4148 domain-containing protein [Burkholderia cepacia]TET00683.1 DUF4148 domain-containing protein [Burkholderia cepacia]TEU40757.1 DUF4148 domain-containing protein [Burkholderia cepacia]TEU51903.1 DUF4148 domain-containing protein [Burkholderia cepacia]
MKSIIATVVVATAAATALLAAPAVSYAQSSHSTLTRAQVRQELFDLEAVGYDPVASNGDNYPGDIVAAQERLTAKRLAARNNAAAAYGPGGTPGTDSGAPAVAAPRP